MRRLIEIIILWGFMLQNHRASDDFITVFSYALISLALCLCLEILMFNHKNKNWQLLILIIYFILCVINYNFIWFLPILLYSCVAGFGLFGMVLGVLLGIDGFYQEITLVIACGLSIYLSYLTSNFQKYNKRNKELSDEMKEQMISLEKYNAQLLENKEKGKEITRLEERNKISRQLHDYLGHTISSSIMQIEALKLVEIDSYKKESLQLLQDTLSNGMNDIRKQLHGMYDSSFSLNQKLEKLVASTPQIRFNIQNQIQSSLSFDKQRDIYNIIRESLANTIRHSDADVLNIFLKEQGKNQVILIYDNGSQAPKMIHQHMGLSGMEDTAQKYNGKLNYYYKKGFHIHMILPENSPINGD